MFGLGIIVSLLNIGSVNIIWILLVIAYNILGILYAMRRGKLSKQSPLSQVIALSFFICSWQLVIQYVYANKFDLITFMLTIALGLIFAGFEIFGIFKRKKEVKIAADQDAEKKRLRAERKAARQAKQNSANNNTTQQNDNNDKNE